MTTQDEIALRNRIVGVLLRDARTRADRSKRECAEALGVSTATITAYEQGRKSVSLPELEVLACLLDVPLAHFLNERSDLLPEETLPVSPGDVVPIRQRIVGALLRKARIEAGKSQKELAEVLGCSAGRISSYEYGDRPIPLPELEVLARVLERDVEYFLDDRSGPLGEYERQIEFLRAFRDLPPEIQEFISRPINRSYLEVAMKLADMPAGALRVIAEGILEITY